MAAWILSPSIYTLPAGEEHNFYKANPDIAGLATTCPKLTFEDK
jgi:hypothetical protein